VRDLWLLRLQVEARYVDWRTGLVSRPFKTWPATVEERSGQETKVTEGKGACAQPKTTSISGAVPEYRELAVFHSDSHPHSLVWVRAPCMYQGGPARNSLICKARASEWRPRVTRRVTSSRARPQPQPHTGPAMGDRRTPRVGLGFHGSRPRTSQPKNRFSTVSAYCYANMRFPSAVLHGASKSIFRRLLKFGNLAVEQEVKIWRS
jgi:hypothetical protein